MADAPEDGKEYEREVYTNVNDSGGNYQHD